MAARFLLVLSAILAIALGGPISGRYADDDSTLCARTCTGTSKFNYIPGMTYQYEYNVQTKTAMEGATDNRATLGIRATAEIEVLSKCDLALKLRDVKVYRSDPSSSQMIFADESGEFKRNLERFPLRFSFQDGVVEELCPLQEESTWALNVKRGILTAIQNSMDRLDKDQKVQETDVVGNCFTDYKVTRSGWSSVYIKKVKDVLGCTDRHGYQSSIHATPYRVPSEIQSLPLMKSTHENEMEFDTSGLLRNAFVREVHTFRPFSQSTSGATTNIVQKLTYKTQSSGVTIRQDTVNTRAGLNYEHVYGNGERAEPRRDAEKKLEEICRDTREDIRPDTPRLFSELVYIMKNMDVRSLQDVYNQLKRGSLCSQNNERTKKFFIDAIPMASTTASVQFLTELLTQNEVSGSQAEMWITSLALIHYPTLDMIKQVKGLVESPAFNLKAMLPVSTMINNYCAHNSECADESAIVNTLAVFEKNIAYGCYVRDNKLDAILMTLRALGNAGHSERIVDSIRNCFTREGNPNEVRIAAIQAFRRLPCTADRNELFTLYRDGDEDSEVRIAAYLSLMECPSEDTLSRIQETLETEKANQVGSFVWSHLTNLMESSSPQKQAIRRILENADLKKEFDLEKLKYSRNYEGSLFLEKFNAGAMVDSNLIFSEQSFIPRSAMLNLTVDLFGNSINLLEIGGRIEGLEYLLETYLGPYGYFGDKKSKKTIEQSKANLDKLRGAVYMRMFGNEMVYKHFKGMDSLNSATSFNYLEFLIKMSKKHDYSFTQSVMLMDSSMVIPTSSGLPLNLTVNGTATVSFEASGQVDLRKAATKPRSLLIDGTIKPSGSIQIAGTMSMDAFVTKAGMRVMNTWHSSTALKGQVELTRGKVLSVDLDLPQKKMEIIDVRTDFFMVHGDIEKEEKLITENRKSLKLCTGEKLAKITGVELCNEFQWPNASMKSDSPYFPFTGPFSYSMTFIKRDTHSGYKLLAEKTETKTSSKVHFSFDTPGSVENRKVSFNMSINHKDKNASLEILSPWKSVTAEGILHNEKNLLGLKGKLQMDDRDEYGFTGRVKIARAKDSVTYKPQIEIRRPQHKTVTLSGSVNTQGIRRANVDLTLSGVTPKVITVRGTIQNSKMEKSIKAELNLGQKNDYSIDASFIKRNIGKKNPIYKLGQKLIVSTPDLDLIKYTSASIFKPEKSVDGDLSLSIHRVIPKPLTATWKLAIQKGRNTKYSGTVKIRSKFFNSRMTSSVELKKKNTVSTKMSIDYSVPAIRAIKPNKFDFSSKFTDKSTRSTMKYLINANFVAKKNPDLNFITNLDLTHNKKESGLNMEFKYGNNFDDKSRQVTLKAEVNHELGPKTNIKYDIDGNFAPKDLTLRLKGKHKHDKKNLDSNMRLDYGGAKPIIATLKLKDSSRRTTKMAGSFSLKSPLKDINVQTDLMQSRNNYTHKITVMYGRAKSSAVCTYDQQKGTLHTVESTISLDSMETITIKGKIDLDLKDFEVSGEIKHAGKVYLVASSYKYSKDPKGKWSLELECPAQHATIEIEGGKKGTLYSGSVVTKWNLESNSTAKFNLNGELNFKSVNDIDSSLNLRYPSRAMKLNFNHKGGNGYTSHADFSWSSNKIISLDTSFNDQKRNMDRKITGTINIETPFKNYKKISGKVTSENTREQYSSKTEVVLGSQGKGITGSFTLKKPYLLSDLDISIAGSTPFTGFRSMSADLTQNIDPRGVSLNLKGKMEQKNAEFNVFAVNKGNTEKRHVEGKVVLRSNIRGLKDVSIEVKHNDDNIKFVTDVIADINGDKYQYDLDMTHSLNGWQYENEGNLVLIWPDTKITNNWRHRNTKTNLRTTFNSEWGRGRKIEFKIFGNHQSSTRTSTSGGITLQTPWDPVRDIDVNLDNVFERGFIRSSTELKKDRTLLGSLKINYRRSGELVESDFHITSPFSDDLKGKLNTKYISYPKTGHVEFEWAPDHVISADGSIDIKSAAVFDSELRITTPFRNFRNILLTGSNKYDNNAWVSSALVDYAPRKSIKFDSHVSTDVSKKIRVTLTTPFENFRKLETGLNFDGGIKNFNSRADFNYEPHVGKYSGMLNWNIDNLDINGKLRVDTPLQDYTFVQLLFSSQKNNDGKRHSRLEAMYRPREVISFDLTYKIGTPFTIDAEIQTPFEKYEHLAASVKHASRRQGIETNAEMTYAPYKTIAGLLRLRWKKGLDGIISLNTPFVNYEKSELSFRHDGELTDFKSHGEVEFANQKAEGDIKFSHDDKTDGSLKIVTPFSGFELTKLDISRTGGITNLQSQASLLYGDQQEIKMKVSNNLSGKRLDSRLQIQSPFLKMIKLKVGHNGNLQSFRTKVEGSYGRAHSFSSQTGFTFKQLTIDLNTQLALNCENGNKDVAITFHKDGDLTDLNTRVAGEYNGKKMEVTGVWKTTRGLEGSLSVTSPFDNFKNTGINLKHETNNNRFNTEGRITYMDGKSVEGSLVFSHDGIRRIKTNGELRTPFSGFRSQTVRYSHTVTDNDMSTDALISYGEEQKISSVISASLSPKFQITANVMTPFKSFEQNEATITHEGPIDNCQSYIKVVAAGKTITGNAKFMHDENTIGELDISTDIPDYEKLIVRMSREGTWRNLRCAGLVTFRDESIDASFNNRFTGDRLVTSFLMKNPYTEDINFNIDHNGKMPNFNTKLSASMGPDASLASVVSVTSRNLAMEMDSSITYSLAGSDSKYTMKLGKDGPLNSMTAFLTAASSQKTIDVKANFQNADKLHGDITVQTPFQNFENLALSVDHSGTWNRFSCEGSITYMDDQTISGKINHMNSQFKFIKSSIEAETPFPGFKVTKLEYRHKGNMVSVECDAMLQYGGEKISGKLSASMSPKYEFKLITETPFNGFSVLETAGSFSDSGNRYGLTSEIKKERRNMFRLDSSLDLSNSPMSAYAVIETPLEKFEKNELKITHDGTKTNFRTTVNVQSPLIKTVSGEASLFYQSPFDMNAMMMISDDKKIAIENRLENGRPHSHIELSWAPQKQIIVDGSYKYTASYYENSLTADASLTTPFETVKNARVEIDLSKGSDQAKQKIEVDYNDESVLDMDIVYNKGNKHETIVTVRKPKPMMYTLTGEIGNGKVDTEIFANWDTDERGSNVKFVTSLNDRSDTNGIDKDMKIKLIHPARTLGIEGSIAKSGPQTMSVGKLIWNEDTGDMFSYDMELTDKSRGYSTMYDGTLKIGTPVRDFKVDGSYSDARGSKVVDGTFFWDDSRDQTKQVDVKAVLSPSSLNKKAELSLRFPSIGKDIKLNTELTINDGRTVFDSKTEFSYSPDSRKTLTLTSKVEDISYGYSNKNYSLSLGVSHPYTDVDMRLRSNVGSSDEKYTGAMDIFYLTARRERKNFALRGEINKIRNQLNVQMVSPLKSISVSGEIESSNPYRLRLRNIYDNDRIMNSEITIDTEKRSIDFNTNYDLDHPDNTINMHASYINSSALKAELYRATSYHRKTDSVMAVRLNSSRILHTRIAWRPELMRELQEYLTVKIQGYGRQTKSVFHDVYESVGHEVRGKYSSISKAVSEELAPFVSLIESEMQLIERQLDNIRRDLRRMYSRNDLYIADMGDTFIVAFNNYKDFVTATKARFSEISDSMSTYLEEMTQYPVMDTYEQLVAETLEGLKNAIDEGVAAAVEIVSKIDDQLKHIREQYERQVQRVKDGINDQINSISNHPRLLALRSKLSDIDYQGYINTVKDKVNSLNIPEKYNSVIYNAREAIGSNFQSILEHEDVKHIRSLANDAYQEGVWAYKYWEVEDNLKKHLRSIYEIIKELVEEEIEKYKEQLVFLEKSRITVWDPEHGEIQIEVYLPIPLKSLDSIPEVDTTKLREIKDSVNKYIPDRKTVQQYYEKYVPRLPWTSNTTTLPAKDDLQIELDEYMQQRSKPRRQRQRYSARRI